MSAPTPPAGQYVEEYLYRRRPPSYGAETPAAHSVTLGAEVADGFGGVTVKHVGPMTLQEATARGWSLGMIHDAIDGETARALDAARADLTVARAANAALEATLADLRTDRARLLRECEQAQARIEALLARATAVASSGPPILGPDGTPLITS